MLDLIVEGILGDGSDESAAINVILANGGAIYAPEPPVFYGLGSQLLINTDGTNFYGDGAASLFKRLDGVNGHMIRIDADEIEISRMKLDGNRANNSSGQGITTAGTAVSNINIFHMNVFECPNDGIALATTLATNVNVKNCYVTGCDGAGITVRAGVAEDCNFSHNTVFDTFEMNCGVTSQAHGIVINGNVLRMTNTADNITCYGPGSTNVVVTGNMCSDSGNNGIHIGADDFLVTGNLVRNTANYGIQLRHSGEPLSGAVCSGNVIYDVGRTGIWVDTVTAGVITGNSIRKTTEHGIWIKDCNGIIAKNNVMSEITLKTIEMTGENYRIETDVATAGNPFGISV